MKPTDFAYHLSTFLTSYMTGQRNLSKNTIKTYRDAFVLLLEYFKTEKAVPPEKLTIRLVDKSAIDEFLTWLENVRENGISTRNQRLAAIHAFFKYLQSETPEHLFHCQKILSIPFKRTPQPVVPYLSEESMQLVLSRPDISTLKGRRDLTLLCTLYDTGARVQELCDLTVRNIRLDILPSQISLTGKGSKTRHIPIMAKTTELLRLYMREQKLNAPDKLDMPLFFNSRKEKLTRQGVAFIVAKYSANNECLRVSPHVFRHTKAMHMTQADVNPVYIRDILGHVDLKTTAVYSKSSVEMKRKALEKLNTNILPELPIHWSNDGNLMDFLNSLK